MVDTIRLLDIIKKRGYRLEHVAAEVGITRQSLSDKIKNKALFKLCEVQKLVTLLSLTTTEIMQIFFKNNVA